MFERLRQDVLRAQVKQEHKHDKKFAARVLGVRRRNVMLAQRTDDGTGLAVYFWPSVQTGRPVWLLRVGLDGVVYGEPVVFKHGSEAIGHFQDGRWRDV